MNILISSIGTATSVGFLKLIRMISEKHYVVGIDLNDFGYTAGSQLVDKFEKIPLYNDESYIEKLLHIIDKHKIDIFIPIHDFEVKKISEEIERFEGNCRIIIPTTDVLNEIQDKEVCTRNISELGITCPRKVDLGYNDKKIVREKISVGSRGIQILEYNEHEHNLEGDVFVQEFIKGDEYTVDILNDLKGNPLIIVPRKRLEVKAGVATKVEITKDEKMINDCKKILSKFKIPGFCNVQFIKTKSGENYFIELNPRFGGFSISSSLSSINMVELFLKLGNIDNNYEENMSKVKWNSIVTRYYEEVVYNEE